MPNVQILLNKDPLLNAAVNPQPCEWVVERRSNEGLLLVHRGSPAEARRQVRAMLYAAEQETGYHGSTEYWRFANPRHMDTNCAALCLSDKEGRIVSLVLVNAWGDDVTEWTMFGAYTVPAYRGQGLQTLLASVAVDIFGVIHVNPLGAMKHYRHGGRAA